MRKYDISSKAAYLAWVTEWKVSYTKITEEIRALKKELAQPHVLTKFESHGWVGYTSNMSLHQHRKAVLRVEAKWMLSMRHEAKEASWKAKQAALNKI